MEWPRNVTAALRAPAVPVPIGVKRISKVGSCLHRLRSVIGG